MIKPVRIQRKRTKGYNMQEHSRSINGLDCVYVGRPTKWGNPFKAGDLFLEYNANMKIVESVIVNQKQAVNLFRECFWVYCPDNWKASLRGKNLACWCPLDSPCHADVLLEIANQ